MSDIRPVRLKRYTAAAWAQLNTVLLSGEPGFEKDTNKIKVGDGETPWNDLGYVDGEGGGGPVDFSSLMVPANTLGDGVPELSLAYVLQALFGSVTAVDTVSGNIGVLSADYNTFRHRLLTGRIAADGSTIAGVTTATHDQTGVYTLQWDTNTNSDEFITVANPVASGSDLRYCMTAGGVISIYDSTTHEPVDAEFVFFCYNEARTIETPT